MFFWASNVVLPPSFHPPFPKSVVMEAGCCSESLTAALDSWRISPGNLKSCIFPECPQCCQLWLLLPRCREGLLCALSHGVTPDSSETVLYLWVSPLHRSLWSSNSCPHPPPSPEAGQKGVGPGVVWAMAVVELQHRGCVHALH